MTKNETIVKTKNYEDATGSSGNSVDVRKLEREAKEIDEEIKKLIKRSEKTEVNIDKIEEHSERRKKIRKAIDEAKNISLEQEKRKGYAAMIQNPKNNLKNKRELYNYLLKFGDIYELTGRSTLGRTSWYPM